MAPNDRLFRIFSNLPTTLNLAKTKTRQGLALIISLFLAMSGGAQQPSRTTPLADSPGSSQATADKTTVSIPAGTRIALVLTSSIQTRYVHRGDDIYAQTTSPVIVGNEVAIPPGTFVQGKVDKLERKGGRRELHLQSMSLTFPDGYVARISGPVDLETNEGYALNDPGRGRSIGAFAMPAAGAGLGALIGHSVANTQPNTITNTLPPGCTGPPPGCLTSSVTTPGSAAKATIIGSAVGAAGARSSLSSC
jgi:hypothetical protein